jgi:succinoglycan biosynthesis protein ExoV
LSAKPFPVNAKHPVDVYYYKAAAGNFGDDLNTWVWPRLLQDCDIHYRHHGIEHREANESARRLLVGIGTLLDDRLPARPRKLIAGAGIGYGPVPRPDSTWDVRWVRGPLSARALGAQPEKAITDGAALLAALPLPAPSPTAHRFGFMPHHDMAGDTWRHICEDLGVLYLDPRAPVESTLAKLQSVGVMMAEAMHGAIAADCLRVPWVALSSSTRINEVKWLDWCASLDLEYSPRPIPALWPPGDGLLNHGKRALKERLARSALQRRMHNARPVLSAEAAFRGCLSRLQDAVDRLRADLAKPVH